MHRSHGYSRSTVAGYFDQDSKDIGIFLSEIGGLKHMFDAKNQIIWVPQMGWNLLSSLRNQRVQWRAFRSLIIILITIVAGCATDRESLVKSGQITLKKQTTGKVSIAWCDAYEDGDGFLISGVLRRCDTVGLPIKARVDVAVIAPDGRTIEEACSSAISVPRRMIGRYNSFNRFKVRFSKMPPHGSLIHLVAVSGIS
jgi:hypothetical protein